MFRKKQALIFLILAILSLIILTIDAKKRGTEEDRGAHFLPIFSYLQEGVSKSLYSARDFLLGVLRSKRIVTENRRLEEEMQTLLEQISRLREYEHENVELRKLLGFRERGKLKKASIGAEVIGRNPVNWYQTIVIDRGERDGIRRDMVVVSGEVLVGRIRDVGHTSSQVVLILDEKSSVSAITQRTREHGIVQGQLTDTLKMKYLSDKTEVMQGDAVRSSGLGGIYPKGLLIGTVTNVERSDYGLTMSAEVVPAVDFSRLENVLVIKK